MAATTTQAKQAPANPEEREIHTLSIAKEVLVAASAAVLWGTLLEEIGPRMGGPNPGQEMPMKLEAWPGGRWFRDLENNTGHLWGHVQVIKGPPHDRPLLEICGPMAMSYAVAGHIQWRLNPEGKSTRLTVKHTVIGLIPADHREGFSKGWGEIVEKIKRAAEKKA